MWRFILVGALGFEPRASYTPCKRASRTAPRPDYNLYYSRLCFVWQARKISSLKQPSLADLVAQNTSFRHDVISYMFLNVNDFRKNP